MRKQSPWRLIFFLVVVAGCTFQPEMQHEVDIEQPEPITVDFDLAADNIPNPYYLLRPTVFRISFDAQGRTIMFREVKYRGEVISSEMMDGKLVFYLFPFTTGTGLLEMEIHLATGSGSFADKVGVERYIITKVFSVIVDTAPPVLNSSLTANYENGYMTYKWGGFSKPNADFNLGRTYLDNYLTLPHVPMSLLTRQWVDSGYVGGRMTLKLLATGLSFEQQAIGTKEVNNFPVDFSVTLDPNRILRLSWTQSLIHPSNVTVTVPVVGRVFSVPLTPTGNHAMDTLTAGDELYAVVRMQRSGYAMQEATKTFYVKVPLNFKPFKEFAMLPQADKVLIITADKLYRYRLSDFQAEDSVAYSTLGGGKFVSLSASQNGVYAMLTTETGALWQFDPLSFSSFVVHDLNPIHPSITFTNSALTGVFAGTISNTGIAGLRIMIGASKWGVVYDMNARSFRWGSRRFEYLNPVFPPFISRDGTLAVYNDPMQVYSPVMKWMGTDYDTLGKVKDGVKFFSTTSDELINVPYMDPFFSPISGQSNFTIYDLTAPAQPDGSLVISREFTLQHVFSYTYYTTVLKSLWYDEHTGYLVTRYMTDGASELSMHDLSDFHFIKKANANTYTLNSHYFSNGYQLSSRAFIEQVP